MQKRSNRRNLKRNNRGKAVYKTNPKPSQVKVNTSKLGYQMAKQEANYGKITKVNHKGEVFPESLRTQLTAMVSTQVTFPTQASGPIAGQFVYRANALKNIGPSTVSPLSGGIQSFSVQYPSYLSTLLGPNNTSGASNGIYGQYIVLGSRIRVQAIGGLNNTSNLLMTIFPTKFSQYNFPLSSSAVAELPLAKSIVIPYTNTSPIKPMYHALSTKEVFGSGYINQTSAQYIDNYVDASYPVNQWFWNVRLTSMDVSETTAIAVNINVKIEYDVIFFARSTPDSLGPTQ